MLAFPIAHSFVFAFVMAFVFSTIAEIVVLLKQVASINSIIVTPSPVGLLVHPDVAVTPKTVMFPLVSLAHGWLIAV